MISALSLLGTKRATAASLGAGMGVFAESLQAPGQLGMERGTNCKGSGQERGRVRIWAIDLFLLGPTNSIA